MRQTMPVRLSAAEDTLIAQLRAAGAEAQAERIAVAGLPTRRVESYHYTDLKTLLKAVPPVARPANAASALPLPIAGAFPILIANGVVQAAGVAPEGVIVGKSEGSVLTLRDDVLVRLNAAMAKGSLSLTLEGAIATPIQIDRRIEGEAGHSASSARVFVADGAEATIVETYSGTDAAHVGNHATYIAVGKGARLTHITVNLTARQSSHFATCEYVLADGAQLRTLVIHAGADLSRSQVFGRFAGEGAHADFSGLNLVSDGQHCDMTLDVSHAVPNTTSKEVFKQVARGRSKAVFQGKLVVARDAQKTDGKMMMQGLMLSDEAEILSKPELEIYADDVVCGHGSTCGRIDEESLFYLMSRGIAQTDAEVMLVRGFLQEVVDPIEGDAVRDALSSVIKGWLAGR